MTKLMRVMTAIARDKMNEYAKLLGLACVLTSDNCKNKLDSLRKKSKKIYAKVRRATATGQLVESNFDLEAAKAKWAQFSLWHKLFFAHPSFGPGGSSQSSADLEATCPGLPYERPSTPALLAASVSSGESAQARTPTTLAAAPPVDLAAISMQSPSATPSDGAGDLLADFDDEDSLGWSLPKKAKVKEATSEVETPENITSKKERRQMKLEGFQAVMLEEERSLAEKRQEFEERMLIQQSKILTDMEEKRQKYDDARRKEDREYQDKREQERREYEDKRDKERREAEEKRDADKMRLEEDRRQSDKAFQANLLANLFKKQE